MGVLSSVSDLGDDGDGVFLVEGDDDMKGSLHISGKIKMEGMGCLQVDQPSSVQCSSCTRDSVLSFPSEIERWEIETHSVQYSVTKSLNLDVVFVDPHTILYLKPRGVNLKH